MRLTVVVPIYNVENYLKKCVDSIISQTYANLEIVLVDDGSTDKSGVIADEYAANYSNVKTIHQKNQGLSGARNTGIDHCRTELIAFVDSDDYIEPNMYQSLVERLDENGADISIGGVCREKISGEKKSLYRPNIEKVFSKKEALIELNSLRYFNMSVCNVVFKTELFNREEYGENRVRFPLGKKSEDEYTAHKLYARANKVAYTSTPYYHYLMRPGSITSSTNVNIEQIDAVESRVKFYETWFPEISYSAKSECVFSCMAVMNGFIVRNVECPEELKKRIGRITRMYYFDVMRNKYIRALKKAQVTVCTMMPYVYKRIINKKGKSQQELRRQ